MKLSRMPMLSLLRSLTLLLVLIFGLASNGTKTAQAHFLLNLNVRIIHVEHLSDGLRVYLRLPMPYLVADRLGPVGAGGLPAPAPYTTNGMEDGRLAHYLDAEALRADPSGLGRLVADGHQVVVDGHALVVEIEQVRAYPGDEQPSFASIKDAKASFGGAAPAQINKPLILSI